MKIIANYVTKGGEGKTTFSVLLAYELAKQGLAVCLWDADFNQGQTTYFIKPFKVGQFETGHYMKGECSLSELMIKVREDKDIYLLPNAKSNSRSKEWAEEELSGAKGEKKLKAMFKELEALGFDVLIIDMNPSLGVEERAILTYVDEIINVFQAEILSLEGYDTYVTDIAQVLDMRELRNLPMVKNDIIILNKLNESYSTHKTVRTAFKAMGKKVFDLHSSRKIADVVITHQFPQELEVKNDKKFDQIINELDAIGKHIASEIRG